MTCGGYFTYIHFSQTSKDGLVTVVKFLGLVLYYNVITHGV